MPDYSATTYAFSYRYSYRFHYTRPTYWCNRDRTYERQITDCLLPSSVALAFREFDDGVCELKDVVYVWQDSSTIHFPNDNEAACIAYINARYEFTATKCYACDDWYDRDDMTRYRDDYYVCDTCKEDRYVDCEDCGRLVFDMDTYTLNDNDMSLCGDCFYGHYIHCDNCNRYYHVDDNHHCCPRRYGCMCDAPLPQFTFPFGNTTVSENERINVSFATGIIDDMGIYAILGVLQDEGMPSGIYIWSIIEDIGTQWQTKRGNFTKRLSGALYKQGFKLSPSAVSKIGNIASAHSAKVNDYWIELTRDLNQSPTAFYHGDSCWFGGGSYGQSRCCLKSWGGIGLRSYANEGDESDDPNGRAWIQPITWKEGAPNIAVPTHHVERAKAFMVYNCYGELEGYTASRIVAQMVGMTYTKVTFDQIHTYVNSNVGYLIANEATCRQTQRVAITGITDIHDTLDAHAKAVAE